MATGSMSPPHPALRSPGVSSRWRLHRQIGQWFRWRVPGAWVGTVKSQCPHRKEELKNGFDMGWSLVAGPARMGSVAKASLPSGSTDVLAALSGARRDARQGTRADRRGVQARRLDNDGGRQRRNLEEGMSARGRGDGGVCDGGRQAVKRRRSDEPKSGCPRRVPALDAK